MDIYGFLSGKLFYELFLSFCSVDEGATATRSYVICFLPLYNKQQTINNKPVLVAGSRYW